jgi:glycosyltransferase involved in cell wall biosynthesis
MIRDGENGCLVPCETWEPLAACINRLLADDALRDCVAEAELDTARGYTVEAMARAHAAVFNQE